jgi:ABC-type transport system involved in Fe-S cluster assembly fused permease/ATPase subunit
MLGRQYRWLCCSRPCSKSECLSPKRDNVHTKLKTVVKYLIFLFRNLTEILVLCKNSAQTKGISAHCKPFCLILWQTTMLFSTYHVKLVAWRLRHRANTRRVSGSIPSGVAGDFLRSYRRNHVLWGRLSL